MRHKIEKIKTIAIVKLKIQPFFTISYLAKPSTLLINMQYVLRGN